MPLSWFCLVDHNSLDQRLASYLLFHRHAMARCKRIPAIYNVTTNNTHANHSHVNNVNNDNNCNNTITDTPYWNPTCGLAVYYMVGHLLSARPPGDSPLSSPLSLLSLSLSLSSLSLSLLCPSRPLSLSLPLS